MPKDSNGKRQVMLIDPTLQYERRLKFNEKHAGWEVFKMVFWGTYILIMGLILLVFNSVQPTPIISFYAFFGWGLTLFAVYFMLYGLSISLHLKLMRKYA